MTTEEMMLKSKELRAAAKALQRKISTIADLEGRKATAREMHAMFDEAKRLHDEAKQRMWFEKSVEQEFRSTEAEWHEIIKEEEVQTAATRSAVDDGTVGKPDEE